MPNQLNRWGILPLLVVLVIITTLLILSGDGVATSIFSSLMIGYMDKTGFILKTSSASGTI